MTSVWNPSSPSVIYPNLAASNGASLVGGGDQVVANVAGIRLLSKLSPSLFATALGNITIGDGLGGDYYYNSGDTTSLDNGSTIIVATDGGRWYLAPRSGVVVSSAIGKNVLVNGDCSIAQVNGGSLITPVNGSFPLDMVSYITTQSSKLQVQQVSNKLNSLGAIYSRTYSVLSSFAPANTDAFEDLISIEGYNFARFQYGTANAKAGSLQFKVNASVAGTYSGSICNYAGNRSYPFTFTVAANTDTLIQIPNIPGDTGGSWVGATNAGAAFVRIDLGSGTNFKSTANSWQAGNFIGVTGTTNLVSQVNGSTLTISDVQFEVGSVCTQFERKLYGQNFVECQRYLVPFSGQYAGTSGTGVINLIVPTGCAMRAIPTCTNAAAGSGSGYASSYSGSTWSSVAISANSFAATGVGAAFVNIQATYAPSAQGFPCAGSVGGVLSAQI